MTEAPATTDLQFVRYPDRGSWLEARRFSIGSSDAAGIMGESNWSSPLSLNYLKRGLVPQRDEDSEREEQLDWHRRREDEIATWWWERQQPREPNLHWKRTGQAVFPWDPGDFTVATRLVDGVPLSATFDRLLLNQTFDVLAAAMEPVEWGVIAANVVASVELKNAGAYMEKHWQEEPPLIYSLQLQHQLLVAGVKPGYMVASIGGQPPVWAEQLRDGEVCGVLMGAYQRFWRSVLENEDLPADFKDVTSKAISARFPQDDGSTVKLAHPDAPLWFKNWKLEREAKKVHEELYKEADSNLKQMLGEATFGILPDGTTLSLKADKKGRRNRLRVVGDDTETEINDGWGGL